MDCFDGMKLTLSSSFDICSRLLSLGLKTCVTICNQLLTVLLILCEDRNPRVSQTLQHVWFEAAALF